MALDYIELVRAGPRMDIDSEDSGVASLLIGSSSSHHEGPDYLEISGGLPHCYKICPRSISAARKWVAWLETWIEAEVRAPSPAIHIADGSPHSDRTVYMPEFCGYFWAEEWEGRWCLFGCEEGDYAHGGRESDGAYDLTAPESAEFIAAVNARLFTSFRFEDFAGR